MYQNRRFAHIGLLISLMCGLTACARPALSHQLSTLSGTWQVTKLTGEPTPDNQSRLDFNPATHQYHAYFGCNHFTGHYAVDQHKLTLARPAGTMMMCDNIEDERTGMGTLEFVRQWRFMHETDGLHLQLLDEQGHVRIDAINPPVSSSE
ncbi:META domain-containing protein [Neisseriaceae bacterium ESL0693]|nr:META domain-containing protein [Neisseriaceae bacterium ESL0693]